MFGGMEKILLGVREIGLPFVLEMSSRTTAVGLERFWLGIKFGGGLVGNW